MLKNGWRGRLPAMLYWMVLVLFPIALLEMYTAQQQAPMPGLHLLSNQPEVIYQVIPGSGAEEAGIRQGDIIRQMNGRPFNFEHLSLQISDKQVGELLDLQLERNGQLFDVSIPLISVGQVTHRRFLLFSSVALIFWISSLVLVWRSFLPLELRLLFLLGQSVALGLLFPYVDVITWFSTTSWAVGLSGLGGLFSALLLLHFHITFPVMLGTRRQRRYWLGAVYGVGLALVAGWIIHNYTLYLPHELGLATTLYAALILIAAIMVQVYVYKRRANPDGRRRLRLILVGDLIAGGIPVLFILIPSAVLGYSLIPEWTMALCLLAAPLAYIVATMRHDLFEIDRILNHSAAYTVFSLVILIFCVAPISLIYWLIGDWPGHLLIVTGLLLLAAAVFDPARKAVQRLVDRAFYGGWYDYPGVVEKISDALARSLEWEQLVDILTHQTPVLMHLRGAMLRVGKLATPDLDRSLQPQRSFPLIFEKEVCGLWVVGPRRDDEDFSSEDIRILQTLAHQAAIAVSNMLLVRRIRDQLVEIQANREILAQIDRQLLSTREEERARLARDLHDGPVQTLIGINVQLGMIFPPGGNGAPGQNVREEIKGVVYDLRSMCAELRPPMLDTLGLGVALRSLAQDWSAQSNIPVQFEQPEDLDLQQLHDIVAVNLYRVAQEALSNISRHAEASHVQLCLEWNSIDSLLTMMIRDDGKGFEYAPGQRLAAAGHMGLVNMQERVALFGGHWHLASAPGQGTTIYAAWNVPQTVSVV